MSHDDPATAAAAYLETLYQKAPFGYVITDRDDVIVRVNDTFLSLTGFAAPDLVGRPFRSLLAPGSQLLYETTHLPVVRLYGVAQETILQLVRKDGTPLHVLINSVWTDEDRGMPEEARIAVMDASGRVSYENELRSAQRSAEELASRIAILQNASAALADSESETQIAQTFAGILETALVASAACVAVSSPTGSLEVIAGDNPLEGLIAPDAQLLGKAVLALREPMTVSVADVGGPFAAVAEALATARLHSVVVFPIMNDATTPTGVAAAFFGREREFAPSEMEVALSVARQVSQVLTRVRAQAQLAHAAQHDQLTGLANRALVRAHVTAGLAGAHLASRPFTVMFLDLDGFKLINDRLGHHAGDAILRDVACRLQASVRASDIVGRYGGDEFVIICGDTSSDHAVAIAARIHDLVCTPFDAAAGFPVSASIGIATVGARTGSVSTDDVIAAADTAMYDSKRQGPARTTVVGL